MYNGQKVYDVHGHVTAPDTYRAGAALLMASNTPQAQSVLMQPSEKRPGPLQDENFKRVVEAQHVKYMDERNIDVQIIGPRPFLMMGWMSQDILPSWTRLTNDAIGLQCSYYPDRFLASMQLPQNGHAPDTKHVLDEIDRCKKEWGAMSVYVGPDPEGLRQTPGMDKPYWYPLYEKCERDGLPIIVHGTNHQDPRLSIINQNYQVGFLVEQFIATQLLGFSDVFDRYPELKVIVCHCGGALSRFAPTDNHNFQRDTSKNLFYDTCAYEPTFLEAAIKQKGVSQMLFGTEAPGSGRHLDPRTGRTGDNVVPTLQEAAYLTDADRMDIIHNNPAKVVPAFTKVK
ncbi:MAG TPA: amidohydrolase family protein [Dehalococcoidia bacterium]